MLLMLRESEVGIAMAMMAVQTCLSHARTRAGWQTLLHNLSLAPVLLPMPQCVALWQ